MADDVELLSIAALCELLDQPANRVQQLVRDGRLIALRDAAGKRGVPADFVQDGDVVKALPSVISLLRDVRYTDEDIVEWLYRGDDSLPGTPIQALRENRGAEVKRRAQASGF